MSSRWPVGLVYGSGVIEKFGVRRIYARDICLRVLGSQPLAEVPARSRVSQPELIDGLYTFVLDEPDQSFN